jgi:hypothetical protein
VHVHEGTDDVFSSHDDESVAIVRVSVEKGELLTEVIELLHFKILEIFVYGHELQKFLSSGVDQYILFFWIELWLVLEFEVFGFGRYKILWHNAFQVPRLLLRFSSLLLGQLCFFLGAFPELPLYFA